MVEDVDDELLLVLARHLLDLLRLSDEDAENARDIFLREPVPEVSAVDIVDGLDERLLLGAGDNELLNDGFHLGWVFYVSVD